MLSDSNYIVLVHGLWDNPCIFDKLAKKLTENGFIVLTPHLPHKLGRISIRVLAEDLNSYILKELGEDIPFNLLGFSMGGLISRYWLQRIGGSKRTKRFISLGSPHKGTFTAQLVPFSVLPAIAEMKRGSHFLKDLNKEIRSLKMVECSSYFCLLDLMVFPGWQAVLPLGSSFSMPVLTHKGLIFNSQSVDILTEQFLQKT